MKLMFCIHFFCCWLIIWKEKIKLFRFLVCFIFFYFFFFVVVVVVCFLFW